MEYAERIVQEYNRWADRYEEATKDWKSMDDASVAAFMCNAINNQVLKSSHKDVRDYFAAHARN